MLGASGYDGPAGRAGAAPGAGRPKQLGIGVSSYVEVTAPVGLHIEYGAVEVNDDGSGHVSWAPAPTARATTPRSP